MASEPPPGEGPPHGVSLEEHARISAEIAEADRSIARVLEAHQLTETQWNAASVVWMDRIGQDVRERGEAATLPHQYSAAFSQAQDSLRPLPPMDAASYAALVADVLAKGDPTEPRAVRGLSTADYLRLSRHWAGVLASDPVQAKVFFETFERLQPNGSVR